MRQKRAYKYRIYPTEEQKHILAHQFGCCRFVYNWALRKRTDACYKDGVRLYYKDLSAMLPELKKQEAFAWLSEVASVPLQQALRHLDRAFLNFFEGRAERLIPSALAERKRFPAAYRVCGLVGFLVLEAA